MGHYLEETRNLQIPVPNTNSNTITSISNTLCPNYRFSKQGNHTNTYGMTTLPSVWP